MSARVSEAYGVLWPIVEVPKRITFVVNRLRVIDVVFRHELSVRKHRDDVLRAIDAMYRARPASWLPGGSSKPQG